MGVLAPWYLAGLAALGVPLVLHLIRRTPRGQQPFSSLMFLLPSPPRLTRRSRLDQVLLLVLRLAALTLLAVAFARPFWREAALLSLSDLPARRVAILIDTSASMRRGNLWRQAVALAERELADAGPRDDVALYAFHERVETLVGFSADRQRAEGDARQAIRSALASLRPTWRAADLGSALAGVASELEARAERAASAADARLILISDLAEGTRLDALQGFEWPTRVTLVLRPVTGAGPTNAWLQLVRDDGEGEPSALRVRISNLASSTSDQFYVHWATPATPPGGGPGQSGPGTASGRTAAAAETAVQVPPGQSRVIRLPRPSELPQADRLVLRGDDQAFDNTLFAPPLAPQKRTILYLGTDSPDDAHGPQHYLRLALAGDPLRQVTLTRTGRDQADWPSPRPDLVVLTGPVAPPALQRLRQYLEEGGTVLAAPADREAAASILTLVEGVTLAESAPPASGYLLWGEIDFAHPLFVPLAQPPYNDFTKIHFWRHQPLAVLPEGPARVVARYDNGDPAILDIPCGKGRMVLWASLWTPAHSQLALSTKFVPLVEGLLDLACGPAEPLASVWVGQSVPLPRWEARGGRRVVKPDGREVALPAEARSFDATDLPGIYRVLGGPQDLHFAVNVAPAESLTTPLAPEALAQLGVPLGRAESRAQELARFRQQHDTELESRQKLWRWLLVAALVVLGTETWLAGRASASIRRQETIP
jgi:hypothetical protein